MAKREMAIRQHLIIQHLRRRISSFEEIQFFLENQSQIQALDLNISKRTFQRDIQQIRVIYNIDIQHNKNLKVYQINFDEQSASKERILEAFDVFNALNISDRLSDYIHFESRKALGTENMHAILHAIKNKKQIYFEYHSYWNTTPSLRQIQPLALKEADKRWYLIGFDESKNAIRTFGLDRLSKLEVLKIGFTPLKDFNIHAYFKYHYGILKEEGKKVETIVLSFDEVQRKYIKSLPLHESQTILIDTKKEFIIQLNLVPTYDFKMKLLSYGARVKVLQPKSLQ